MHFFHNLPFCTGLFHAALFPCYHFFYLVHFPFCACPLLHYFHVALFHITFVLGCTFHCTLSLFRVLVVHPSKHLLLLKTSSTRLQRNNFASSKTSWRRLEDMSWRCLEYMFWRRLEDIMGKSKILTGDICI